VTSIGWMLAGLSDESTKALWRSDRGYRWRTISLDRLSRFMAHGVAVAVTLLLAVTTFDYFKVAYPKQGVSPGVFVAVLSSPVTVLISSVALFRYRSHRANSKQTSEVTSVETAGIGAVSLKLATYGVLAYAVIGPLFAGFTSNLPISSWHKELPPIITITLCIGLILPSLLLVALIQAIPASTQSGGYEIEIKGDLLAEKVRHEEESQRVATLKTGTMVLLGALSGIALGRAWRQRSR
jgi:hypothetical protein